ncbi:hypothetical protein A4A49_21981 [Nicotiana attenuata]|uniref:Uncharacterized protein n=1 Tax=Nicotiana attenuata TaxID=49451 RepID=A0A1J6IA67_NICAT|nr:hypothetical protein A4A49_21981 [Nicotiana attenuata]
MVQVQTGNDIVHVDNTNVQHVQGTGISHQINGTSRREIVPATGNVQQTNGTSGREIVPAGAVTTQQIQTAKIFDVLKNDAGEGDDNNRLVVVDSTQKIATPTPKETGRGLNPTAPIFSPISPRSGTATETTYTNIDATVVNKTNTVKEKGHEEVRESTAQWVNGAFGGNNVTMYQSCQEVPSQSLDTNDIAEQELLKAKINFVGGRLWCDQMEDDSDEGNFSEGLEDDVNETMNEYEDQHGEEISVNGKNNKDDAEAGDNVEKNDDAQAQLRQDLLFPVVIKLILEMLDG